MGKFVYYPKSKKECMTCPDRDSCDAQTAHQILMDCKSFYYTYNLLEPYNRIPQFTGDKEEFEKELEQYFVEQQERPMLSFPWIVNGALAVELALKFLTFRETHTFQKKHNLKDLYEDLPSIHKMKLLTQFKAQAQQNEDTLLQNLETFSEAFVDFRYPFGKNSFGISGIFHNFVKIVCEYALELEKSEDYEVKE